MNNYLPAEWEEQDAVQLTWPHAGSDWAPLLGRVLPVYHQLVWLLLDTVAVVIAAPTDEVEQLRQQFSAHPMASSLTVYPVASNDTWARDHGPITVIRDGKPCVLDFRFNGWGNKFAADMDDRITLALAAAGAFPGAGIASIDWVLEGGAIEVDGNGSLLTTSHCLLNPNRNGVVNRDRVEAGLRDWFGISQVLWLDHGYLAGDDTDSHIDTLARFAPDNTIVYVSCDNPDDEHYPELQAMANQLINLRNIDGRPYRLLPLPWPGAKFSADGERLPATYANFLVTNGQVLVPVYDDPADQSALAVIAEAFPGRKVTAIDGLPLIEQHGSLHCITMQLPRGVLVA